MVTVMRLITPAAPLSYTPWRPHALVLGAIGATAAGVVFGLLLVLFWPQGYLGPYEYHVWRWEAQTLPSSGFALMGIGHDPADAEADRALAEYFRLTTVIRDAENRTDPDPALIDAMSAERAIYENDVERVIEGRIDEAVRGAGLQRALPLFHGIRITWPPVDFELTSPPRLLVRSPRDEIRRAGDTLLRDDLTLAEVEEIEAKTDNEERVSLVVAVGGIAVYPAIVRDDRSYDALLSTAAHEWVHHYLAFYPLGEQWGNGGDAEALNETTADIAGEALAQMVRAGHPVDLAAGADGSRTPGPAPTVDFNAEMRALRVAVDDLLARGDVAGAERLMEERRLYLADNGIYLRKINQAYFAFYGTYGESPASTNPIGPLARRLFELTGDVGSFLSVMRQVTSRVELEQAVAALEGAGPGK